MFNNISNPKWFGDWSRLEDEYLDNNFTEIQDNFAFSKRKKNQRTFWCHRQSGYRISSPRPGDRTCHRRLEGGLRVHRP